MSRVRLAARVGDEWRALTDAERVAAKAAFATLDDNPIAGAPLLAPLRGYWTYHAANLRILYRVAGEGSSVAVLKLGRVAEERQ
ncbi:MAG: type II toxin-antitoxin system RelE family toxin [Thermoanaerobaculia bacterium]